MQVRKDLTMIKRIFLFLTSLVLLAFIKDDFKSEYTIPLSPWSVCVADIDVDQDIDILIRHAYNETTHWSGISFLKNNGAGQFTLMDSIYLSSGTSDIYAKKVSNSQYPDIITQTYENGIPYIVVLSYFQGTYIQHLFPMNYWSTGFNLGDVNGDTYTDIIVYLNVDKLWGVLYNDGAGNFSSPQYYTINYPPTSLACRDLNNDGRDDVIIGGQYVTVYFSYPTGFVEKRLDTGGLNILISDFDNNGLPDIISYDGFFSSTYVTLFTNTGNNNFISSTLISFVPSCNDGAIADFNNNGLQDIIFMPDSYDGYYLFYNKGDGSLSPPQFIPVEYYTGEGSRHFTCGDLDGNGYTDIVTVRCNYVSIPANLDIRFNDSTGNFSPNPQVGSIEHPSGKTKISAFPNPFHTNCVIGYELPYTSDAEINIYDLQGRLMKKLFTHRQTAGKHFVNWDGTDQLGNSCRKGIYYIRLQTGYLYSEFIKIIKV
jgi:hypothetical protein